MSETKLEAREYLDRLRAQKRIIRLGAWDGEDCNGRGQALVLSDTDQVAIMMQDCGDPKDSGVRAGDIVNYSNHPEGEPKIIGSTASVRP